MWSAEMQHPPSLESAFHAYQVRQARVNEHKDDVRAIVLHKAQDIKLSVAPAVDVPRPYGGRALLLSTASGGGGSSSSSSSSNGIRGTSGVGGSSRIWDGSVSLR